MTSWLTLKWYFFPPPPQTLYLHLTWAGVFSCLFCGLWVLVLSWFLDEGKRFINDWGIVHMRGQRAGWTGCWAPGGSRTLRACNHDCWWYWWCCYSCSSLHSFTIVSAQHPFAPEINEQKKGHITLRNVGNKKCELECNHYTNLSSKVRHLSWLRLRLGYTVGVRVRSFDICLNLSSLLRWGWPEKKKNIKNGKLLHNMLYVVIIC